MHRSVGLVAVLLIASAGLCLARVAHLRAALYDYDVTRGTAYDFTRAGARRLDARLQNRKLQLAAKQDPSDVVLIELRIEATFLGRWFAPSVEIEGAGATLKQTFEHGGSGLRYLNVSAFPGGTTLQIRGEHVEIRDQSASVYYLHGSIDPAKQRILVISPHPDDAEIAAFGLYSQRDAYVVTITAGEAGEAGPFASAGSDAFLAKGLTRAWNSVTVPMLGGLTRERTANLGYFDATLVEMKANPTQEVHSIRSSARVLDVFRRTDAADLILSQPGRTATWQNLLQDLQYVIERVQPDVIVTPYPRLDSHPDHQMTTVALIETLKRMQWRRGSLLLYTNHSPTSELYPYGEAGEIVSLPTGIEGIAFDGLVSNPLSPAEQAKKRVALDAQNDLRATLPVESLPSAAKFFHQQFSTALAGTDDSYLRRAVRDNEFFFEVHMTSLYDPGMAEHLEAVR